MKSKNNRILSVSFVLLAAAFWGTAGIFVRLLGSLLKEMQIVFLRAFISSIILAVVIIFKDRRLFKVKPRDIPWFAAIGIVSIVFFNFCYYKTMSLTSLSVAAVLLYTAPFFVVFISVFFFKERLNLQKVAACLIAFLGCCMVSGVFGGTAKLSASALIFGLLTGFGYGMYTVFGEVLIRKGYSTLTITFYAFLFAFLGSIPFANIPNAIRALTSGKTLIIVFGMAVVNTVLPYIFYTTGLKGVEPTSAPIMANLEPVVATLIGTFVFKEELKIIGILGILMVLTAVIILNLKSDTVKLKANAKINIALAVTGKREDGYHLIDTVMQTVGIYDIVRVKKSDKISVVCDKYDIPQEKNIAYKAAKLFFEETGILSGASINIKKGIPESGGLGGGSADAAAVLKALNEIYSANLSGEDLKRIALKLGADVPFFIDAITSRAQGIGEILTPIKPLKNCIILLVKNGNKLSTGEMYSRLDEEKSQNPDIDLLALALDKGDYRGVCNAVGNCFEKASGQRGIIDELINLGADAVSLTGSGPTVFALFKDKQIAKKAYAGYIKSGIECYLTKPGN